jgi:hypothetical protein
MSLTDTARVLAEVAGERAAQDQQWGGASHDDEHGPEVWDALLWKFLRYATPLGGTRRRHRLVQLAAVAVAAIECIDRGVAAQTDSRGTG